MNVHVYDIPQKPMFVNEKFVYDFFNTEHSDHSTLKPMAFASISLKTTQEDSKPRIDLNSIGICTWDIVKNIFGSLSEKEQDALDEFQLLMDYSFPRPADSGLSVESLIRQTLMTPFIYMSANEVPHSSFPSYIHYMIKGGMCKNKKKMLFSIHTKFSSISCYMPLSKTPFKEQFEKQIYSEYHITQCAFSGKTVKTSKTRYVLDDIQLVSFKF